MWTSLNNQSTTDGLELPSNIKTIMDSWSLQTGYPVVTVRRDYSNQSAILTQVIQTIKSYLCLPAQLIHSSFFFSIQERFYLLTNHNSSDFPLWWIPLTFTVDFNATYSAWMMGTEDGIELELPASSDQWIIFNVNQVGTSVISIKRAAHMVSL